jgi:serine/threonine-protein kinase
MPAKVTLTANEGPLAGQEFAFEERTTCIIGRGQDCYPCVPDDRNPPLISRHHCLLDINPPSIRIRDLGSLNGTRVNGALIGQRQQGQATQKGQELPLPELDLHDGDEIGLSDTVFRVGTSAAPICRACGTEIPKELTAAAERTPGAYLCARCRQTIAADNAGPPLFQPAVCAECGREVAEEIASQCAVEYVCTSCQENPLGVVKRLLQLALDGEPLLAPIQGYEILRELGKGGMGAVYLARHRETGEEVALKLMLPHVAADARACQMFLREVENTRALRHANIVRLLEAGCSHGTFFFAMEYCDGGSVGQLIEERGGRLAIEEASAIILQALAGLEYAHQAEVPAVKLRDGSVGRGRGLIHRDLKPQNLYLCGSGATRITKIGDYGLSKAFDLAGLSGQTRTGEKAGTPHFMPRQQVLDFRCARPEVDVWAIAATLYFMLTGLFPRDFPKGKDPWQVMLESQAIPIRQRDPSIPPKLAAVIDEALIDNPSIPFKSATELREKLEPAF